MKILILVLLAGGNLAKSTTVGEGVSLGCGTTLTLSEKEQPIVIFSNVPDKLEVCKFTIKAPKDLHVELSCNSPTATANRQDATDFHGQGPVVVEFKPTEEQPQMTCRAGLEEDHMEPITKDDIDIDEFDHACNKHPKDKERRAAILAENEKKIQAHNADRSSTWTARVTCLSDMTDEELETTHTGRLPTPPQEEMDRRTEIAERELLAPLRTLRQSLPPSVDLTTVGRVSTPKAQGGCGSCSVFAAVSTVESCMHKATGTLPTDLSEQHMMDCAYGYGGSGCHGGMADRYNEWMYRRHNGGLANEAEYPYRAATSGTSQCQNSTTPIANHGALVTSHQEGWTSTEEDIMRLLSEGHSVTTGMKVVGPFYTLGRGVFQTSQCRNCRNADGTANRDDCPQDHDITIVGYGMENGVKYWKVKNSWGTGWGEGGFGKILRGTGHCGIGIDFSVPICTQSGPAPLPGPTPPSTGGSCGGTLAGSSGTITSEGFPTGYSNNQDCTWTISPAFISLTNILTNTLQVVKFTVEDFELEANSNCRYDYVQFLEADGSEISKICGSTIPSPVFTSGNGASVKFHSDHSVTKKGFRIKYEIVENPSCQGVEYSTAIAVQPVIITSPDYPSNYPNNKECDWTIRVPSGQKVRIVFDKFVTEFYHDPVKIYDGANGSSKLIKQISGSSIPAEIISTGNQLHITFKSDHSITGEGFRATVSGENRSLREDWQNAIGVITDVLGIIGKFV